MTINVTFNDFDEMEDFARKVLADKKKEEVENFKEESEKVQEEVQKSLENLEVSEAKEEKKPEPQEEPEKKETKLTTADIRKAATEKIKAGKATEIKAILSDIGASNVAKVPEDKFEEFMKRVGEL